MVNPRRIASSYLLSGLLKCGACGKSLSGQEGKSGKFAYYVCGTLLRRGRGTCDTPCLSARRAEGLVVDTIKARVLAEENLKELVRLTNEELDDVFHDHGRCLKVLEGELADVERRLERLCDVLETGKLKLDDLSPRIRLLRRRQGQLQAAKEDSEALLQERREHLHDVSDVMRYVDDMRALLQEGSLAEQKSFIRTFVKEIVVTNRREVVLRFTLPLPLTTDSPPSGVETLSLPKKVLASLRSGGADGTRTRDPLHARQVLAPFVSR